MDVDSSHEAESRVDPIRVFADRLRRLQADSGGPSVRDLVRLTAKVGSPYTRGTIQDKLAGRSAVPWEFVAAFVRACALHSGAAVEPDLAPWRKWHAQMAGEVAALRAGRRRVVRAEVCPYRGLEAFTAEHTEWFYGRAAAVQEVVAGLGAYRRGVVLLGPSGAGKSSLLQAGVLPALAAGQLPGSDRWITLLARPGKDLFGELDRAGLAGAGDQPIGDVVAQRLAGEPAGARLLLVLDQFEEVLTPASSDEQDAVQQRAIDQLAAAIGAPGLSVVLVLRDDFYPRLASQAPAVLQALMPGLLNVPATLNTDDLRDIITKPAVAVGLDYQDGLPERIITDVLTAHGNGGPARHAPITVLPLLELTLQQLWQRRSGAQLTHEAYQRIGGIAGALTTWCDTAIEQLPAEQRTIAQRVLTALVRPADNDHHIPAVRQQVPLAALRRLADTADPAGGGPSEQGVDEVLAVLTEHRIVTTRTARAAEGAEATSGVPVAELVHEALIRDWATLRDWVGQDHRFQDWLRRAGERHTRWVDHRDSGDLLHGSDLAEGVDWSARRGLPDHIAGFLTASRRYQRAGIRRTRIIAAVLAGLLVVALTATGLALRQRQTAIAAQRVALSRQLAAQSIALMGTDPDLASLLAVEASRTRPTAEAAKSVYTAAASPLLHRLSSPLEKVGVVAFSPDGRTLAGGGTNGAVRLWDMPGGQARAPITGHIAGVSSVAFSRDGRTLATGGEDGTIRLWQMPGGQPRAQLRGHKKYVGVVVFSPDGRTLASGGVDGTVRLWDVAGAHLRATFTTNADPFYSVVFSPDGRTVASGSADSKVRLWEVASGRTRATLTGHTGAVYAVAFSPDGRIVATAGDDRTVRLWEMPSGKPRAVLIAHTDDVRAVAFSPDGRTLASGSNDHTARLWDMPDGKPRATLVGHTGDVHELKFSPNGRILSTHGRDQTVRLWEVAGGQPYGNLDSGVRSWAFSPDGHRLATASQSGTGLWDMTAVQPRAAFTGDTINLWNVAFSPDGRILATSGADRKIRLWDLTGGQPPTILAGHIREVTSVAFSPDGGTLASSSQDGTIRLWDVSSKRTRAQLGGVGILVRFSPDGRTLAGGDWDGTVRLWDVGTGKLRAALTGHTGPVWHVAFSPDGRTLATASDDDTIRLWDLASMKTRATLTAHTDDVSGVAFSPDGRTLASGGWDLTVRLWDMPEGKLRATLTGHTQGVWVVAFSPDGRTLASGSADYTARLWDVATGHTRVILGGNTQAVNTLAFNRDGRTLAIGNWDGMVRLWQVALPTLAGAIEKICRAVNRDLTPQERAVYLPGDQSSAPVCP